VALLRRAQLFVLALLLFSGQGDLHAAKHVDSPANLVFVPGSFDPPTRGHLALFEAAFQRFGAARLIIMVNTVGGPKDYYASFQQRREMILSMLPQYAGRVEIRREPVGGAPALLQEYTRVRKNTVTALVGEDAFHPNPNQPDNLFYKVIRRPGQEQRFIAQRNVERISIDGIDGLSSSLARSRLSGRASTDEELAPSVRAIIERERLYAPAPEAELPALEARYQAAYLQFGRQVAHTGRAVRLPAAPPPLNAAQSPDEWQDKFLRTIRSEPGFPRIYGKLSVRGSRTLRIDTRVRTGPLRGPVGRSL
jgi:cytidyltransferase-like protein